MNKNALVVIDVQNFFINKNTEHLPEKIAEFIESNKFDFVLFTRFVNNEKSNLSKHVGGRCSKKPEIDMHPALLKFVVKNNLFYKSSYSIFKSQKFVEFLETEQITDLYLCGISTYGCILASAYDGFDREYNIKVLKDLSASHSGKELNDAAIKIIEKSLE